MTMVVGTGHFVSWDGGCVFLGQSTGRAPEHSHYALQVAFGSTPGIAFRPNDKDGTPWTAYDAVLIPSRQPHAMDSTVVPYSAVLLIEPETREGRAISSRFGDDGITPIPRELLERAGTALFAAWHARQSIETIAAAARDVIASLTGGEPPIVTSDERILRAVAHINSHLDDKLTLEDVADVACLSPSRFRHLFVEQTGMALRPYILWRRFLQVWSHMAANHSLSAAAHAAGFADAAHLSRTSRRMFGFPPSALRFSEELPSSASAPARASETR